MRILSAVVKNYYNRHDALEPMFLAFTHPLIAIGHQVDHFNHVKTAADLGRDACGELFVSTVKSGTYDVVLFQNQGDAINWMPSEAVAEAARYSPVVAWNTDDDWQWESYTKHQIAHFSFMVTTYPHIYEANKNLYPNLLLSQWGCLDMFSDFDRQKDLDFTFAGQVYGSRGDECRFLRRRAGLKAYGLGSQEVNHPMLLRPRVRRLATRMNKLRDGAVNFQQINEIWNRSKISYAPMGASVDPNILQIKSRAFEMGLSGTMMLCQLSPNLERYYEPGIEFVPFGDLEDCADKAKYYLRHENERQKIATAYYKRTHGEHLWQHRFAQLFKEVGLAN